MSPARLSDIGDRFHLRSIEHERQADRLEAEGLSHEADVERAKALSFADASAEVREQVASRFSPVLSALFPTGEPSRG